MTREQTRELGAQLEGAIRVVPPNRSAADSQTAILFKRKRSAEEGEAPSPMSAHVLRERLGLLADDVVLKDGAFHVLYKRYAWLRGTATHV